MRFPDDSWSPLILGDFLFPFLEFGLTLKRQGFLKSFGNMQLVEMFLRPHYRLRKGRKEKEGSILFFRDCSNHFIRNRFGHNIWRNVLLWAKKWKQNQPVCFKLQVLSGMLSVEYFIFEMQIVAQFHTRTHKIQFTANILHSLASVSSLHFALKQMTANTNNSFFI